MKNVSKLILAVMANVMMIYSAKLLFMALDNQEKEDII